MLEAARDKDGEVVFEETGDPLIDKWERELAMGLEPDLSEGLSDSTKATLARAAKKRANAFSHLEELDHIEEKFRNALTEEPMYAPKGSGELLGQSNTDFSNLNLLGKGKK